ncbi:hypothetical protein YC2023_066946 [Brassica napus]
MLNLMQRNGNKQRAWEGMSLNRGEEQLRGCESLGSEKKSEADLGADGGKGRRRNDI